MAVPLFVDINRGCHKIGSTFLGSPELRILAFRGLYWGSPIYGTSQLSSNEASYAWVPQLLPRKATAEKWERRDPWVYSGRGLKSQVYGLIGFWESFFVQGIFLFPCGGAFDSFSAPRCEFQAAC